MNPIATRHLDPERVSAWISGDLSERDTAVVRAHVESCADCSMVAAELRDQLVATRILERPEPPATLWSAIEGALDKPAPRLWSWRATLMGAFVGAAAAGVVIVSIVGGFGGMRGAGGNGAAASSQVAAGPGRQGPAGPSAQAAREAYHPPEQTADQITDPLLVEAERELERAASSYEQAVNRLRKILEREQVLWDPETRSHVGDRLARLDEAVVYSRAVARRDPGDSVGADMLFSAYQRQIQFLAEAVRRGSPATAGGLR